MTDDSPKASENIKPNTQTHSKAVKMMESSWDNFEDSPEPKRTATALRDPKRHNQPSWTYDE
jgi:ferric-dicitrate binding protein FerR (iron transport regulator)